jgi:hypothetical protein
MRLKVNKVFVLSMNDDLLRGKGTFEDPNIGWHIFEMQNAMRRLNLYSKLQKMEMSEGSSMTNFIKEIKIDFVVVGEILIDNILVHALFNVMPSSYKF